MSILDNYPTRPLAGFPGTVLRVDIEEEAVNAESSAEIPFGSAVQSDTVNTRNGVKIPTANTNVFRGIAIRGHTLGFPEQYGTTGVKPGESFRLLRKGRILVKIPSAVTARGTRGYVQAVANGGRTPGQLHTAADSTNTIDTSQQISLETLGGAGDFVEVEIDTTREQG